MNHVGVEEPRSHEAVETAFVWSPDLPRYNFGPGHPMAPVRLELTHDLVRALNIPGLREVPVAPIEAETLELVHSPEFIAAVQAAAAGDPDLTRGLGSEDVPVFREMHTAASRIVGSTLSAAQHVWGGSAKRALSIAGGMHHAMPDLASGFCVYNDVAIAISWLLEQGVERVAYVDLDAHHGDGVEQVFWNDPRVLTMSIHESGHTLFPGSGYPTDSGGEAARGYAVNVALPAHTGGGAWLRAVEAVVAPLVAEFQPEVIVSQHGCDSHPSDQLTHLQVSVEAQLAGARLVRELAERHAQGRWIATGGGGYTVVEVVPRVWAGLAALAAGGEVDPTAPLPEGWLRGISERFSVDPPKLWGDGEDIALRRYDDGFDPDDPVDQAIAATRRAVFPHHGLDTDW